MAIDPRISLAVQTPNIAPAINIFENALMNAQTRDIRGAQEARAVQQAPLQNQILQQQLAAGQQTADVARDKQRITSLFQTGQRLAPFLESGDIEGAKQFIRSNISHLQDRIAAGDNVNIEDSMETLRNLETGNIQAVMNDIQGVNNIVTQQRGQTAGQREFASLTRGLSEEDKTAAQRVKLGLDPRAASAAAKTVDVGGVPHVFDPVKQTLVPAVIDGEKVTAETVSESKALIKQRTKFAEMTGATRAKTIDKGFDSIAGIDKNIRNIDRAISALDRGAKTGAVDKFLPTIRAASKELNQIQGELALDVVGAVTFGALSQGELDLARDVALPTGLDEPELKKWLQDKKIAQNKLRDYLSDQVQFLDQGGTVAGFLRAKEREAGDATKISDTTSFGQPQPASNIDLSDPSVTLEQLMEERKRLGGQ